MRILFIANHLNVGGISSYLLTLSSGLVKKGHSVYLASSAGELVEKFESAGITHINIPINTKKEISPKIIACFLKLKKLIKSEKIDLIHSNSRTTQVLANLLSRNLKIRHVFTCHGFFKPKLSRKWFPCWPDAAIAISCEVKEHLISDLGLKEEIYVINNGIDLKSFGDFSKRDKVREKLSITDEPLIGIIARLSDVKGHIYLIRSMPEIIKKFPSVKLLIIGEGKMQETLEKEVSKLGIKNNVLFIANIRGTSDTLSAMDVFVMPSLQEGLGLALMEAMAQGLAVVGSSVGGIKTLIQDKISGLLVEPKDVRGLALAIISLLSDSNLRSRLGSNARKFITENFSQEKMVNLTEGVYEKCLKEKA